MCGATLLLSLLCIPQPRIDRKETSNAEVYWVIPHISHTSMTNKIPCWHIRISYTLFIEVLISKMWKLKIVFVSNHINISWSFIMSLHNGWKSSVYFIWFLLHIIRNDNWQTSAEIWVTLNIQWSSPHLRVLHNERLSQGHGWGLLKFRSSISP